MGAAGNQHPLTVSYLLDATGRIDPNLKNIVRLLFKFVSFITTRILFVLLFVLQKHRTALMIAAENGDPDTVREFKQHESTIDINTTDEVRYFVKQYILS